MQTVHSSYRLLCCSWLVIGMVIIDFNSHSNPSLIPNPNIVGRRSVMGYSDLSNMMYLSRLIMNLYIQF